MTMLGNTIVLDVAEAEQKLPDILAAVETQGKIVQIQRAGQAIAVIRRPKPDTDPLQSHSELKAIHIASDAFAPATVDEWPEEDR